MTENLRAVLQKWREIADEIEAGNCEQKRSEVMVLRSCAHQVEALLATEATTQEKGSQPLPKE